MQVNIMSWNTQLYEYGNQISKHIPVKAIDYGKCIDVINIIRKHMEKNNAIAILNEIPLRCNVTNCEHIIWTILRDVFPMDQYTTLFNINANVKNQIKTTVVIGPKDFVQIDNNGVNSSSEVFCNCFVSFMIPSVGLSILAVHQSLKKGGYISNKLGTNNTYNPDMIIGDFNAGDYTKKDEDKDFMSNRDNYKSLLNMGYKDLCNGKCTRQVDVNGYTYKTPIDHVLIKEEKCNPDQNILYSCSIDDRVKLSDHYPIYCTVNVK